MRIKKRALPLILFLVTGLCTAQRETIWQIGESDNSCLEFALAPKGYEEFLKEDFGWEDRVFIVGHSKTEEDFPYVLPGATDYWGGTSGLAGIRPHQLNLLFDVKKSDDDGIWKLVVDVLDCSPEAPPLFKVSVNGTSWKFQMKKGREVGVLNGEKSSGKEQVIELPLVEGLINHGGNEIQLTTLEGSWLVFDQIRLEGPAGTELRTSKKAMIKDVYPADYELAQELHNVQPLLVEVQHIEGNTEIKVKLDGEIIFREILEDGRKIYEAPMPAVVSTRHSKYQILQDGEVVREGTVERNPKKQNQPVDYVDTKMGTGHSRWMIAPGPWMPFGMVKISPDNQEMGWQAGYQPTFENVGTFSHIHEWTMAGLGTFPTNGPLVTAMGSPENPDNGYRSRMDKATEQAPLGYYSVLLNDYDIKAELTATTRCSFQRYTYPENRSGSRILVDLKIPAEYEYTIEEAFFKKISDTKIVGYSKQISSSVWGEAYYRKQMVEGGDRPREWDQIAQEYIVHFAMEFDRPMTQFGIRTDKGDVLPEGGSDTYKISKPEDVLAFIEFDTSKSHVVQTRTGLSYVSMDQADLNLKKEISEPFGWDFEKVKKHQEEVWNDLLGRIRITTTDRMEKIRFHTNMYRALVSRNIFSDVDGSWVDATEQVRKFKNSDEVALGCDAFWNTFWNLNQFWNMVVPEWSSKWVKSQLAMYDANGWLAKGPAGMEYIPVMVAEHEIPLIVGAYQMGIQDFDAEKAFAAIYKMQTTLGEQVGNGYAGNRDLEAYLKYKYVPYNKGRFSNTLEYSFDDFAVSQMAKAMGKKKAYRKFLDRAYWWKNAIDPEIGYARLRHSDGSWYPDFDPIKTAGNHQYVEGNAWQLSFFVPQDVPALAAIIGEEAFSKRLENGFNASSPWRYNAPNELYWDFPVTQGNQQSLHFSFLFNWVKKPWLTQKWNRDILERYYGHGISNAYLGDEDQGQMSAWFVMSALGLFQMDGGTRTTPIYEIGSPLYPKVEIDLGERYNRGKTFTITAKNTSFTNKYVQKAFLNGKELKNFWFPSNELLKGGRLELIMGPEPNMDWGVGKAPPSMSNENH